MKATLKALYCFLLTLSLTVFSSGLAWAGESLYQYSTIDALLAGLYDGGADHQGNLCFREISALGH